MKRTPQSRGLWPSASAAEANSLCPSRHTRSLFAPADEAERDSDAESGSAIHAALCGNPYRKLTADEEESCKRFEDLEDEIRNSWVAEGEHRNFREERLWHVIKNPHKGRLPKKLRASGQVDVLYLQGERALVIDFKRGRKAVTPEPSNRQLRWLAALVAINFRVNEVTVALAQHWSANNPPCVYTKSDLQTAIAELESDLAAIYAPNPVAVAGKQQCDYCKAKHLCPEFLAQSMPVPIENGMPTAQQLSQAIINLPPDRLGKFLSLVRLADDAATEHVKSLLAAGTAVPGWRMKPNSPMEKIYDVAQLWARVQQKGVTQERFLRGVGMTKKELKFMLAEATAAKGAALRELIDECLAGLTTSVPKADSLEQE